MIQQKSFSQPPKPPAKKKGNGGKLKIFLIIMGVLFIAFAAFIISGLPSLEELENPTTSLATEVYGIDQKLIGTYSAEARIEVKFSDLPPHLVNALIATEDRSFYNHWGVDVPRIFKAGIKYIFTFKKSGASTITQQLAKNLYNLKEGEENPFETVVRKIREWITAVQIEKNYTKQEIIEMYFNISPFGRGAFGIEMASRAYFKKSVKNLNVNESAMLVAILKGAIYDPRIRPELALARRNLVLDNMVDMDFLRTDECEKLKAEPIKDYRDNMAQGPKSTIAGHFLEFIKTKARAIAKKHGYNLERDGLKIYTTIDSRMQEAANAAVKAHLDKFQPDFDKYWKWERNRALLDDLVNKAIKNRGDYIAASDAKRNSIAGFLRNDQQFIDSVKRAATLIEVGFVAIDPSNGQIRALVGGRDPKNWRGWNHATNARQPGSAFKPFTYLAAIQNGLYPAYSIMDQEFDYNGWNPKNFDMKTTNRFMTLREALRHSINTVTSRIIVEGHVSPNDVGEVCKALGIKSKLDLFPSIALGTSIVTPLELVSAYATIANKGIFNEPIAILKITDKYGMVIENFTSQKREAISEEDAYMITNMLEDALNRGTGARSRQYFQFPAAGKTGTAQNFKDAWYVGFTPRLAAGVWVGFDDERISYNSTNGQGAYAALPIWAMFMRDSYTKCRIPQDAFSLPESGDIVSVPFAAYTVNELGDPKIMPENGRGDVITDIINTKKSKVDFYDPRAHYRVRTFDRFMIKDTTAHQAEEIR